MRINLGSIAAGAVFVTIAGCASAPAAHAGHWRFEPSRCPDLVEDYRDRRESRRDERYDYSRRDVIEDRIDRWESRRDEAVTVCPARAWVWDGPKRYRTARPAGVRIYYDARARHYYRHGPRRARLHIVF